MAYYRDQRAYEEMFRNRTDRGQHAYEEMFRSGSSAYSGQRRPAIERQSLFFLTLADGVEVFDATINGDRPRYNTDQGPSRFKVTALFRKGSSWEERVS